MTNNQYKELPEGLDRQAYGALAEDLYMFYGISVDKMLLEAEKSKEFKYDIKPPSHIDNEIDLEARKLII